MTERLRRGGPEMKPGGRPPAADSPAAPGAGPVTDPVPVRDGLRLVHVTTVPITLSFLKGQVGYLKARGFRVWAVSSPGPALEVFNREEDVPCVAVPMARSITPFADLMAIVRMWRFFRGIRPEIVHGHTPKGGLLAMIAAFLAGVPLRVYSVHGLPLETATGWRRSLLKWTERVSCFLAHRVLPVSPSLTKRVIEERLCSPGKLRLLGKGTINGVDGTDRFVPGADQFREAREFRQSLGIHSESMVIGFVGRVVRDKGILELIQAWSALRTEFPEAHIVVAGLFESHNPLPADVDHILRTDPRIHLLGHSPSMPKVLAAMDVVALPTFREGFPQVPLEAAAMERPVVGTRVTGCIDAIVDGVTGTLVEAGDSRGLAAALRKYLADPGLRQAHGRAARMRILRDFKPENICQAMEREYRAGAGTGSGEPGPPPVSAEGKARPAAPVVRPLERLLRNAGLEGRGHETVTTKGGRNE